MTAQRRAAACLYLAYLYLACRLVVASGGVATGAGLASHHELISPVVALANCTRCAGFKDPICPSKCVLCPRIRYREAL